MGVKQKIPEGLLPWIILFVCSLFFSSVVADNALSLETNTITPPFFSSDTQYLEKSVFGGNSSENADFDRGLMYYTHEQMQKNAASRAFMPVAANYGGSALPNDSKSLLSAVPYIGKNRDQGYCGNCWVWASTGAIEIAHTLSNNVSDQLSIQYVNSNWNNGSAEGNACYGGGAYDFASFYNNTLRQSIPWSNTNAGYADYYWKFGNSSNISASLIVTSPNYPLISVTASTVNFWSGQKLAINNIKTQINDGIPIIYSYYLSKEGWADFRSFWKNQSMDAVWNPDPYSGTKFGGGHSVLILGYNDTAPEPYWLILNSWGVRENRPDGLFKVKMYMDYNGTSTYDGESFLANYFDIFDTKFQPVPSNRGSVSISSEPTGATILLDGKNTGLNTPQTISDIQAGQHSLTLKKTGYFDYNQTFTIVSNQTTILSAVLIPTSSLLVSSTPSGAVITLDNQTVGKTRTIISGITPGSHDLLLVKSGYEPFEATVHPPAGVVTSLFVSLNLTGGKLSVSSNPSGSWIFLDGKDTGYQTPKILSGLSSGPHTLVLKKDLFMNWATSVIITDSQITSVSASLVEGGTNGSIFAYSIPSGALLSLDGIPTGYVTSKMIGGIPAGNHTVMMTKTGFQNVTQSITVKPGRLTTVSGKFSPE